MNRGLYGFPISPLGDASSIFSPSQVRVRRTTRQSMGNNTTTTITWTQSDWDSRGDQWSVNDPTKLVCGRAGIYQIQTAARITGGGTSTTFFEMILLLNGTIRIGDQGYNGAASWNISIPYKLNVGDYIQSLVFQNSGGALNLGEFADDNTLDPFIAMSQVG